MPQTYADPDPYAELDFRADATEIEEGRRKPIVIRNKRRPGERQRPR